MRKIIAFSLIAFLSPLATLAQDDMYFVPTKENVEKSAAHYGIPRETYYSGSNRSVDEYNRRLRSTVEPIDSVGNDIISFDAMQGEYPDSIAGGDFECTRQMSRFDDYTPDYDEYWRGYYAGRASRWGWGWYDPWYYGSYYGWYSPWYYSSYYGWYDQWYYGWGYYRPWYYYGGWYGRPWHGGGVHHVAHRGGNAGWGNRHSTSNFRGNGNSVGYGNRRSSSSQSWSNAQRNNTFNASRNSNFGSNRSSNFGSNRSGGSFGGGSRGGFGGGGGSRGGGFGGRR